MALVTSVPLNTMLADLDESLRTLLKRELGRHGLEEFLQVKALQR